MGDILALVFYFSILCDVDAGNLAQGVFQADVSGSREGRESEGEGVSLLGNDGSGYRYFLERQALFFQYDILVLRTVFQGQGIRLVAQVLEGQPDLWSFRRAAQLVRAVSLRRSIGHQVIPLKHLDYHCFHRFPLPVGDSSPDEDVGRAGGNGQEQAGSHE